jgi:hypothetical protein
LQKNKKLVVRVNPAIPTIFSNFQVWLHNPLQFLKKSGIAK